MERNIQLYPWFQASRSLVFWQAVWFLYFQNVLSAGDAILLAAIYDIASSALEVPSGYLSDRLGRRLTLILSNIATIAGCLMIGLGHGLWWLALGQVLLGAGTALNSGTDSALLYDSLVAGERQDEVTQHELKAWRYAFSGLAVSAFLGGVLALASGSVAFLATAVAGLIALAIAFQFREPAVAAAEPVRRDLISDGRRLVGYLAQPALAWLFALSVAMYLFSHVPFVFGQPFVERLLAGVGVGGETSIVNGTVVALMMLVSVAASRLAEPLAKRIGMPGIVLVSFAMQIGLIAVMMVSEHPLAIAVLLVRMVPGAFSRPFLLAAIHPRIASGVRATYLSLQSLCGRVGLALTLFAVAQLAPADAIMGLASLQAILQLYVIVGVVVLAGLLATSSALKPAP